MLCETCWSVEVADSGLCPTCKTKRELVELRELVRDLRRAKQVGSQAYLELEAENHRLRDLLNEAFVRLESASGPFLNELHRDAKALRRRLAQIDE